MLIRILILLFLFLVSCQKKPSITDIIHSFKGHIPDTLTIMEYNVENLFDMVDNGTEYPEYKPGAFNWTISTYQAKLDNIASVIAAIHPDIGVLVEIENENALNALLKVLKEKHCSYPYYALGDTPNHTITMPAIFSRFPLFNTHGYGVFAKGGADVSRNLLETKVYLGNDTLTLFACHWPSKKEPESARLAAAEVLKNRLSQLSRIHYLIAGDFNENYDESASFHTLGSDDTHGKTGINHVLGTLCASNGCFAEYVTKKNINRGAYPRHFDPWLDIAEDKRMSEMFQHQKNTPDHFLVPPTILDTSKLSYADRSFRVFTWDGRLLFNGEPYRWRMRFENKQKYHRGEGYSDHLPIFLKLTRSPFHSHDTVVELPLAGKKAKLNGNIGFETGHEGWVSGAAHIKLLRDTSNVFRGSYCLKIVGEAGKQNGCAARAIVPCVLKPGSLERYCSMNLRGRGTLSLRMRTQKGKKWTYYNGKEFKAAKAAKYTVFDFPQWTHLTLPILSEPISFKEIQIEIRVKKESLIELWIDDIAITGDRSTATALDSAHSLAP